MQADNPIAQTNKKHFEGRGNREWVLGKTMAAPNMKDLTGLQTGQFTVSTGGGLIHDQTRLLGKVAGSS